MSRRFDPPSGMAEALTEAFSSMGLTDVARKLAISRAWREAVGEQIANRTEPETFRRGTLVVRAASSAWQNELVFLREEIVAKVNRALGQNLVTELKIVTGRVHGSRKSEPPPWTKVAPHRDDLAKAKSLTEPISDPEVRATLERLIEKALRHERHK